MNSVLKKYDRTCSLNGSYYLTSEPSFHFKLHQVIQLSPLPTPSAVPIALLLSHSNAPFAPRTACTNISATMAVANDLSSLLYQTNLNHAYIQLNQPGRDICLAPHPGLKVNSNNLHFLYKLKCCFIRK